MARERDILNLGQSELTGHSEVLDPASVEVRFGDPLTDAPRLRELFTQPTTIEHLAAITPDTTEEEIRKLYENPSLVLLTAETRSGLIVGTYTVQRPGFGSRVGEGMRLVVDENYRNKKIARKLVQSGNALTFRDDESGGFNCNISQVYVIINGEGIPLRVFGNEGYLRDAERRGGTFSWSNRLNRLVERNSQPMHLDRTWYIRNRRGHHITFFPQQRPPKEAAA